MKLLRMLTSVSMLSASSVFAASSVMIASKNDITEDWGNIDGVGAELYSNYYGTWRYNCRAHLNLVVFGSNVDYAKAFSDIRRPEQAPPSKNEILQFCKSKFTGDIYQNFIRATQLLGQTQYEIRELPGGQLIKTCYRENILLYLDNEGNVNVYMGNNGWEKVKEVTACP